MKTNYFLILIVLFPTLWIMGCTEKKQKCDRFIDQDHQQVLESYPAVYNKPSGFVSNGDYECFDDNKKLHLMFRCLRNKYISTDEEIVFFMPLSNTMAKSNFAPLTYARNDLYYHQIHLMALANALKSTEANFKSIKDSKNAIYYNSAQAKAFFNADIVIKADVPNLDSTLNYGKYSHISIFIIQKNSAGYFPLYVFYTDQAKSNFEVYFDKMKGIIRFSN